jgi:hypothetical protein
LWIYGTLNKISISIDCRVILKWKGVDVDWIHVAHSKGQGVPFCKPGTKSSRFKNCGESDKTRNYQLLKEDFTPWTNLQIGVDLSNKDTCESTIQRTFPVLSSSRHTFIHTTGNGIIFCISLITVKKFSINV